MQAKIQFSTFWKLLYNLKFFQTPASVKTDRGGVKERSYHNTMYRIKKPDSSDKPVYVVAEYATPIITYLEACKQSGESGLLSNYYFCHTFLILIRLKSDLVEFKRETIRSFYDTLKRLVELQSSTNDNVNLIFYSNTYFAVQLCVLIC